MEHIHEKGWIHADVKPENILLDAYGVAKLCDFGISIPVSKNDVDPTKFGINPDMEGDSKYLATEVLQETGPTQAGDIFALGITLLEMATDLILPNEGHNWVAIREKYLDEKILNSELDPLSIYFLFFSHDARYQRVGRIDDRGRPKFTTFRDSNTRRSTNQSSYRSKE